MKKELTQNERSKEWEEYVRTYVSRHGITDKVSILRIAGNLEQVMNKYISQEVNRVCGQSKK